MCLLECAALSSFHIGMFAVLISARQNPTTCNSRGPRLYTTFCEAQACPAGRQHSRQPLKKTHTQRRDRGRTSAWCGISRHMAWTARYAGYCRTAPVKSGPNAPAKEHLSVFLLIVAELATPHPSSHRPQRLLVPPSQRLLLILLLRRPPLPVRRLLVLQFQRRSIHHQRRRHHRH